ncbi:hypothetical protein P4133_01400 [Pseudomonas aeruginosa]|nr:hypothetical protein [Pseudomonas aeruginosa]
MGHVLQVAQLIQAQRDSRRSQSVPEIRGSQRKARCCRRRRSENLMPEDIAAALDNTPPSRRSRHA